MDQSPPAANTKQSRSWVPLEIYKEKNLITPAWTWHALVVVSILAFFSVVFIYERHRKGGIKMTFIKGLSFKNNIKNKRYQTLNLELPKLPKSKIPAARIEGTSHNQIIINQAPKEHQTAVSNDSAEKQGFVPVEVQNRLEMIRKDSKRIYIDKKIIVGELTFYIRNVSEYGIELYVSNGENSSKTYYFPKVEAEGSVSKFNGTVLTPSGSSYGWVIVPNIRSKNRLSFQFSSVGGVTRTESVKLEW
ncbi:MAG: hypothetical protein A3B80_01130 [Elusimicrobia bacterium RIFCSPHIGHO2_02_FULL_39_36]|nr:MAG: hypothetical protein A3B80_01130 [Elusimicrobia bacterium RIFCSPHIGHO2_02_FULL_39_36]